MQDTNEYTLPMPARFDSMILLTPLSSESPSMMSIPNPRTCMYQTRTTGIPVPRLEVHRLTFDAAPHSMMNRLTRTGWLLLISCLLCRYTLPRLQREPTTTKTAGPRVHGKHEVLNKTVSPSDDSTRVGNRIPLLTTGTDSVRRRLRYGLTTDDDHGR